MLHTGGGWGETNPYGCKSALGVQQYTIKRYINASFIHSFNSIILYHNDVKNAE